MSDDNWPPKFSGEKINMGLPDALQWIVAALRVDKKDVAMDIFRNIIDSPAAADELERAIGKLRQP